MKIIVDNKIPYIRGALEPHAEVIYLPGHRTTAEVVKNADALITRTRTNCSRAVLEGSGVRFIATATIGFDHIDTRYCKSAGIEWVNAPGCNAESVNQYITAALLSYAQHKDIELEGKTIGIVGVGQVGSRIARTSRILGMNVLLNDPPRERVEGPSGFVSLDHIRQEADIISFHVPLNRRGIDKTYHMVNQDFLRDLPRKSVIINTCRGEVFDTPAVGVARAANELSGMVIDCWENEPGIDLGLLALVDFGTAHIAGYSRDGKANGTRSSVRAVSRFFNLGIDDWEPIRVEPPSHPFIELNGAYRTDQAVLTEAVLASYPIERDHKALRTTPHLFEQLRGDYPVRREFNAHSILARQVKTGALEKLRDLGFDLTGTS